MTTSAPSGGVGVIIAARDAADTIGHAVASALAQPEAMEVVVVDDGSGDATLEAAAGADDGTGRLTLHRLEPGVGPSGARNHAIGCCAAPILAVLDADDYFLPGRLAALCASLEGFDFVADDVLLEEPGCARRALIGDAMRLPATLDLDAFVGGNIPQWGRSRHELGYVKPLMRRAFLERHGLGYDGRIRFGEDFILYARALAMGARFRLIQDCGYVAVQRATSLSHRHTVEDLKALALACDELARLDGIEIGARRTLARHRRRLAHELHLREVLQTRRAKGLPQAARLLLSAPEAAGYVVGRIISDKLALLPGPRAGPAA